MCCFEDQGSEKWPLVDQEVHRTDGGGGENFTNQGGLSAIRGIALLGLMHSRALLDLNALMGVRHNFGQGNYVFPNGAKLLLIFLGYEAFRVSWGNDEWA